MLDCCSFIATVQRDFSVISGSLCGWLLAFKKTFISQSDSSAPSPKDVAKDRLKNPENLHLDIVING